MVRPPLVQRTPINTHSDPLFLALPPLLRRIYLNRGISQSNQLDKKLSSILAPAGLKGVEQAVDILLAAFKARQKIIIVGDFDADGATSCALAVLALRAMGAADVDYLVPDRFRFGYGLTPAIVDVAASQQPHLIITVDNGISSLEGVAAAQAAGIKVVITDHHLAGAELPNADAIVNPNQPGCDFESKNLAGVGVVFYLMAALRARLRLLNWFDTENITPPNLADYLDLVALGTVADVVPLDKNNRVLVFQGLKRIQAGRCRPGISALLRVAKREPAGIAAADLGFAVGPRLNAAGRLDDISLGIECLLAEDESVALALAEELDTLNQERRQIENGMKEEAILVLKKLRIGENGRLPWGVALYNTGWHQGVVGILASRVKELHNRPVVAFAPASAAFQNTEPDADGEIKGSARSVPGFHIRDALEAIATQNPDLIIKYGGHAMAAGLSIKHKDFKVFSAAFDKQVRLMLAESDLRGEILSDGVLSASELSLEWAETLRNEGPWGQGFPEPIFEGEFELLQQRIVGEKHLKLVLSRADSNCVVDAIAFNVDLKVWPTDYKHALLAYRLDVNEYRGKRSVQLMVVSIQAIDKRQ